VAYYITDECISCAACEPECPNKAIREEETIFVIDADLCTECVGHYAEAKCNEVCPVDLCCVPDPKHKETKEQLLEKFKKLNPGKEPVTT
jgi:ferredoxin